MKKLILIAIITLSSNAIFAQTETNPQSASQLERQARVKELEQIKIEDAKLQEALIKSQTPESNNSVQTQKVILRDDNDGVQTQSEPSNTQMPANTEKVNNEAKDLR